MRLRSAVAFLLLSTSGAVFPAAKVADYSTNMVILEDGQVVESMKLYVSGQKSRTEGLMGGEMIGIVRRDRGVSYSLYPNKRVYTERVLSASQPGQPDLSTLDLDKLKRVNLGRETVLGYACTKMRVTVGNMPNGQPLNATVWVADNLGLPIRLETMGIVQENRNLAIAPQRASLFEIPDGYTKSSAPSVSRPGTTSRGATTRGDGSQPRTTGGTSIGSRVDDALARMGLNQGGSNGGAPVTSSAQTTGSRMERNTNRVGGDYRDFDLSRADPAACLAACDGEAQCAAWTYVKPGGPGERAHCWLKETAMPPNSDDCCVSGLKGTSRIVSRTTPRYNMEMQVNRNGGDYRDFVPQTSNPAVCAEACSKESRCRSWTWVNAELEGPTGHCWLKSSTPSPEADDCCVSGLKP
jgi:hypothetical protein